MTDAEHNAYARRIEDRLRLALDELDEARRERDEARALLARSVVAGEGIAAALLDAREEAEAWKNAAILHANDHTCTRRTSCP